MTINYIFYNSRVKRFKKKRKNVKGFKLKTCKTAAYEIKEKYVHFKRWKS